MGNEFDAKFDQPLFEGDHRYYLICCAPRVGSGLLCDLLIASGKMGVPTEYFNTQHGMLDMGQRLGLVENGKLVLEPYIEALKKYRTTPNGIFGFKIQYWMMPLLIKSRQITKHFPQAKFIYLTREDLIGQIVSYDLARRSGMWKSTDGGSVPAYEEESMENSRDFILRERSGWDFFFAVNEIEPLRISYEELAENPERICRSVCEFVGVEADIEFTKQSATRDRQGNKTNEGWARKIKMMGGY
jgi:LPS sulfotransferase NodH